MGADRGVFVLASRRGTDSLRTARILSAAIKNGGPFDVVFCSEGSSDTYSGQVPAMIAELLKVPFVGFARKVELQGGKARIERSLEDSLEVVESTTPLVISVVSEINEPRYPTLIQIMQASKKPVEDLAAESLAGPMVPGGASILSITTQVSARKRVMIDGTPAEAAAKLLGALREEGVLTH
jgi:electron transfer flavoprotein beta subunit